MNNNNDKPLTFGEFTLFVKDFEDFRSDYLVFKSDFQWLKKEFQVFKKEFQWLKKDYLSFKEDMLGFKKDMLEFKRQTQNNFDTVFKMLTDIQTEMKAFSSLYQRHDKVLASHEQRLINLEA